MVSGAASLVFSRSRCTRAATRDAHDLAASAASRDRVAELDRMRAVMLTCEMSRAAANSPVQDAIVIGAGPNGLAAAIACAGAGLRITVYEGAATIGGGTRTAAATLPGFRHDLGSSVYPFGAGSPFFRALPIERYGLEWVHPPHPLAHPFDDGDAVVLGRSLDATVGMAGEDGRVYERLIRPLVRNWGPLAAEVLAPVHWPANPWMLARFGINAARSAAPCHGSSARRACAP